MVDIGDLGGGGAVCGCITCSFCLLLLCILLGVSFQIVEINQKAIRYNQIQWKIRSGVIWDNGRHCVGPGQYLITYDTNLQTFRYWGDDLIGAAWTRDKQEISLELNVFWRYDTSMLGEIYEAYTDYAHTIWEAIALRTIKETTKLFYTTEFFDNRLAISSNLTSALETAFEDEHITIHSLQMGRIVIPSEFETAVQNKVIKQQNEQTTATQRNVTLIEAQTAVITADGEREISIIQAQATANAELVIETSEAYAVKKVQAAYEQGYAKIAQGLGLAKEEIAQYIWARSLKEREATSKLLVGFDGTVVDVQTV